MDRQDDLHYGIMRVDSLKKHWTKNVDFPNFVILAMGAVLGASSSWYVSRHFYYKSKRGTVDTYIAAHGVNCTIDEAWRRITDPANIGNLAWSGPTFPPGATLSTNTEINYARHGVGGLYVIEVDAPRTILLGDNPDWWDKAIRLASSVTGTRISYSRRFHHEGSEDGENRGQSIVDWDLQRLMVCFNDLK